ncbi:hypothetical protein BaRGS_00003858 [Batillaria attramentaria]|uniref:TIR domain-containing protein n=1 Tax=Batillaria attramentaria TaxID=370345 RepID=A0ABD0LYZ5_9CAEN
MADSSSATPVVHKVATSIRGQYNYDEASHGIKSESGETTKTGTSPAGGRHGPNVALPKYMERLKPELKAEDAEKAFKLIEQHPNLHEHFTATAAFLITLSQQPSNYKFLADLLKAVWSTTRARNDALSKFTVAVGFVDKSVHLYQQIIWDRDLGCVTEIRRKNTSASMVCVYNMLSAFLNLTNDSAEFRLRLAETGVLSGFMENIKAMLHKTDEYLESSEAYFLFMMCLQNCSKSTEVLPVVRRLAPVENIRPFLSRRSAVLKLTALMTLATLVDEAESKQLMADGEILSFLLRHFQAAVTERHSVLHLSYCLNVDDFLYALNGLAKNDNNKRLIFEKGYVQPLVSVLESGTEEQKRLAVAVIWELAFDPENSWQIRENQRLMKLLNDIKSSTALSSGYAVNAVWVISDRTSEGARGKPQSGTHRLLQNSNLRTILGKSEVEFALDQLRLKSAASGRPASATYTRAQVLAELRDLVQDGTNRQEFLDKGGIDVLALILENADDEERLQTLNLLLDLSENAEIRSILMAHTLLMPLVEKLKVSVDSTLAQAAHRLARILQRTDGEETARTLDSPGDILVSCHKGDKHKASLVVDHLRRHKYKVRLHAAGDTEEEVEGEAVPTPDETSRPVDGASVVLFCVSLRYKKNKLCRMQCEYAANCKLHKDLIAVLVDTDYRPDGWLQDVLNKKVKVVVDVTDSGSREKELEKLVATLGDRGKGT